MSYLKPLRSRFTSEGFWAGEGNAASGVLPVCKSTGNICLAYRSWCVQNGSRFGTIGGAVKAGMNPAQSALAELKEETGYSGDIELLPAYVYRNGSFSYFNFIGLVGSEFGFNPEPAHRWENVVLSWFSLRCIEKHMKAQPDDFHFGLIAVFENSRDLILNATK